MLDRMTTSPLTVLSFFMMPSWITIVVDDVDTNLASTPTTVTLLAACPSGTRFLPVMVTNVPKLP